MPHYDLLIRGAHPWPAIGIVDGTIAGLVEASAREEVDATGLLVLPGVVDAHVHFNEPGRTEWEGWASGSRAAVAGGVTTVCDMPLNSQPPVVTVDAFHAKRAAAEAQSICDFALWGGLVPGHVDDLPALAECGVIGFKAFMADSGIDDFPMADLATLRAGMRRAAALGLPVAVHAELIPPAMPASMRGATRGATDIFDAAAGAGARGAPSGKDPGRSSRRDRRANASTDERAVAESRRSGGRHTTAANRQTDASAGDGRHADERSHAGEWSDDDRSHRDRSVAEFLASRPVECELDAIRAALDIAGETGCALHVVHVSSGRGIELIAAARARGLDVTAETCPHYLVLTGDDMVRLGAVAKCAPPLREAVERDALLAHVRAGRVDTIGSDHSPSPWAMKEHADFFRVWGGIAGVQHLLPLLLDSAPDAGLDADLVARLTAVNPARRFGLRGKDGIILGNDADLTLVEIGAAHEITAESLFYRHRVSPYVGRRLRARVRRTWRRGRTVFHDGRITATAGDGGRLLVPSRAG